MATVALAAEGPLDTRNWPCACFARRPRRPREKVGGSNLGTSGPPPLSTTGSRGTRFHTVSQGCAKKRSATIICWIPVQRGHAHIVMSPSNALGASKCGALTKRKGRPARPFANVELRERSGGKKRPTGLRLAIPGKAEAGETERHHRPGRRLGNSDDHTRTRAYKPCSCRTGHGAAISRY